MQNDIVETKQKIQHQQRFAKNCDNTTFERTPFLRGLNSKIREFDGRLTRARRSLTSQTSEMSELFCQLIHYEQMLREIESLVQIKESELSTILNDSSHDSNNLQQRQLERLMVSISIS